ncbi:hypothetical protein JYT48_03045 [Mariprofundus ferrooxydans]|nr:hypothetical protein [Mariprofundus ferrooxydans]
MHLICPHCQADYELDTHVQEMTLLCQRCGHEFIKKTSPQPSEQPSEQSSAQPTDQISIQENNEHIESVFPERQHTHLLPWFMIILTLIAAAGSYSQYDAWMDKRWLRSTIINLGFNLPARDKDWEILPDSVQPTWLSRSDASKVFVIKGQVRNLLSTPMLPPRIEIVFFSKFAPEQRLASRLLDFTYPATDEAMQQATFRKPTIDNKTISALASRRFVLLIESPPQDSSDFSLTAKSR